MKEKILKNDILLVDDNPENLNVLMSFLKPKGYKIRIALNGLQAIKSIVKNPPKLILLDIQMPVMGGFETCRRIKANTRMKDIPIIFVSALSDTTDKVKAFKAGGVDYIEKPFHMEEVIARVETHLTLRRQSIQLEEALQQVKTTQNQLIQSEKMVSLGVLSAGIAHEVNNPINFVSAGAAGIELDLKDLISVLDVYDSIDLKKCCSQEAERLTLKKEEVDYDYIKENILLTIQDIKMGVDRTAEIVKGLKRFSRIDKDEKFAVDVHTELMSNVKIIKRLSKKEIDFQFNFDEEIPLIIGFPGQLNQLFMNLIMNAEQAIEKGGSIFLKTKRNKKEIIISITDNGCGIPNEIKDRIFEPFLTTKEVGGGTGLGLSISFGIVENHNGSIEFETEEGKGTTFNIHLPLK